jgi:hypothetical protein
MTTRIAPLADVHGYVPAPSAQFIRVASDIERVTVDLTAVDAPRPDRS